MSTVNDSRRLDTIEKKVDKIYESVSEINVRMAEDRGNDKNLNFRVQQLEDNQKTWGMRFWGLVTGVFLSIVGVVASFISQHLLGK